MSAVPRLEPARSGQRLFWEIATDESALRASQALRYRVFGDELGAVLGSTEAGYDQDHYDPHCDHLLVRDTNTGEIIGSTRLLMDEGAAAAGGFYSASEFDMQALLQMPGRRLEVGRTCIDPRYRQGAAIAILWAGLAEYVKRHRVDTLFGCASMTMHDGGIIAQAIMNRVRQHAMSHPQYRVSPRRPLPPLPAHDDQRISAPLPPLLKAYFRLGARACGEPCYDPDFNCADLLVMVPVRDIDATYTRHFLDRALQG